MKLKILAVYLCLSGAAVAQNLKIPLKIGDKVPDVEFNLLNASTASSKLSDYRGKLVLLDFWATWCGSCLQTFPKMDSLQKEFKNNLQVIFINSMSTGDDKRKVELFLKKWQLDHGSIFTIAVAYEDKMALALFPRTYLPHYVWISPNGKVVAVSSSVLVTRETIRAILGDERYNK